jgi:hypothetical protein
MLQENTNIFLEVKEQVKERIEAFEAGYMSRNMENLDRFMDEMFCKDGGCFVLGIGDEELCLGINEAREMVEGDWEYWGQLELDKTSLSVATDGNNAFFCLNGTSIYSFQDSEERYGRYIKSIASYFNENSEYRGMTYRARLAQINWQLCTLLSTRQDGPREYPWPLKLSGVLRREEGTWRFKTMQFGFYRASRHPDIRFYTALSLENNHAEAKERVHMFMLNNKEFYNREVNEFAQKLQADYLGNNNVDELLEDNVFHKNITISSTYGDTYAGLKDVKDFVESYKKTWDGITVDCEGLLSLPFNEGSYFIATGYLKRKVTQSQSMIEEVANVKRLLKEDAPAKDRLFKIRRDISRTIMETFKGEDYICPVRIEGLAIKSGDGYSIVRLNLTLPSYWIMEGIYD